MSSRDRVIDILYRIPGVIGLFQFVRGVILYPGFLSDYATFRKAWRRAGTRLPLRIRDWYLTLFDKTANTPFDPHYTYHPAWAARIVAKVKPEVHTDISSTLHFSTIVSAFVPVDFYDYRPAELNLDGLASKQGDLLALPFDDNSIPSLSCMHTVEHVGLGRYGDPIDPDGDLKAMKELARVLAPGGSLLFVVPVGARRIEFNAHRVYDYQDILDGFPGLTLKEFSLIPDDYRKHGLMRDADPEMVVSQRYGCGCFWFTKE